MKGILKYYLLFFLSFFSVLSIGFASWYTEIEFEENLSINGSIATEDVSIQLGFADYGMEFGSLSQMEYVSSSNDVIATKKYLSGEFTLDISNKRLNELNYDSSLLINFTLNINNMMMDKMISKAYISLVNYPTMKYELDSIFYENTNFIQYSSIHLKSKDYISLFSLALFDSTIPNGTSYKVPFKVIFEIDQFNYSFINATFSINYMLTGEE